MATHASSANDVLIRQIEDLLTRPRGRPSHASLVRYRSFQYQAAAWDRPRRVIAKVEHHGRRQGDEHADSWSRRLTTRAKSWRATLRRATSFHHA
jgi:hypothetical protein